MNKARNAVVAAVTAAVLLCPGAASAHDKQGSTRPSDNTDSRSGTTRSDDRKTNVKVASSFEQTKQRCLDAISNRQAKLDRLSTKVAAKADAHDADLAAIITTAKSGLIALQVAIEGNTSDSAALKSDCQRIVTDLRIYALRVPQINLVMTIDRLDAALTKLDALHDPLAAAVAAAGAAGDPDAAKVQELLGKFDAKVASANATIDGIDVAALLAITPAGYNANKKVLSPYLQDVRSARSDVKKASQLAKHIAELLEPGDGDDEA